MIFTPGFQKVPVMENYQKKHTVKLEKSPFLSYILLQFAVQADLEKMQIGRQPELSCSPKMKIIPRKDKIL